MLSFKKYITEKSTKLMTLLPYMADRGQVKTIRGLENPTLSEIERFIMNTKRKKIRFIVDKSKNLLAWDSNIAIHDAVGEGEGWKRGEYEKGEVDKHKDKWTLRIFSAGRKGFALKNKAIAELDKRKGTLTSILG